MKLHKQIIPVLLLGACGIAPALPQDVAQNLLLQYARHHCTAIPVYVSRATQMNDNAQWQQAQSAIAWFARNISAGTDYSLVKREAQDSNNCGNSPGHCSKFPGEFRYVFADKATGCWVTMAGTDYGMAWPIDDTATIDARLDDPSAVNILDITVDKETGKSADVVFTVATQPSTFAQKAANGLSALSQYQAANSAPDPSKQYRAHLQKLDATGWEVVSSDFFQPTPPSS